MDLRTASWSQLKFAARGVVGSYDKYIQQGLIGCDFGILGSEIYHLDWITRPRVRTQSQQRHIRKKSFIEQSIHFIFHFSSQKWPNSLFYKTDMHTHNILFYRKYMKEREQKRQRCRIKAAICCLWRKYYLQLIICGSVSCAPHWIKLKWVEYSGWRHNSFTFLRRCMHAPTHSDWEGAEGRVKNSTAAGESSAVTSLLLPKSLVLSTSLRHPSNTTTEMG